MSCDVVMPISDIVKEVKNQLNLKDYVKTNDGVANNLTLKGGLTIDGTAKADLCDALQECLGNEIKTFNLAGETLTISMTDGTIFPVDLSKFVTDQEAQSLADDIKRAITDDYLVSADLDGNYLTMVMKSGRTHEVDLSGVDNDVSIRSITLVGNNLEVTQTDGSKRTVSLATFANTPVNLGNRAIANDGRTVLGHFVNP